MTLSNQITFIDDLIKEDSEITIREYLETLQEIDIIEKTQSDMAYEKITPEQENIILKLSDTGDYKLIQKEAGVGLRTLYKYLHKYNISLKEIREKRKAELHLEEENRRMAEIKARQLDDPKPKPVIVSGPAERFRRPPAIYSNHSPYGIADTLHQIKTA